VISPKSFTMQLPNSKAHGGPRWAWARIGALILFLVTGVLLLASLRDARSHVGTTGSSSFAPIVQT
jgi:hypothetical protein